MKNAAKLALGILTLLAPLLFLAWVIGGNWYIRECIRTGSLPSTFFRLFTLSCFTVWGGLFVSYQVHLWRTSLISKERKHLWLGALWGLNVFAYPVYWYRFVWKADG